MNGERFGYNDDITELLSFNINPCSGDLNATDPIFGTAVSNP
jgi:hypothetical protein